MKHPWCTAILTEEDQAEIASAVARIAIVLIGTRAVVQNLPEFFDARFKHVEGS